MIMTEKSLQSEIKKRVLVLDGAMGTMIQRYNLREEDFRGEMFASHPGLLKGNNDLLCLTRPDVISAIHRKYLEAGADIIETNTFSSTRVSMADYGVEDYVPQMNRAAVRIARTLADEYTASNLSRPRFVVGSVGPTNKSCSISPDIENPALRSITFDELSEAYYEQMVILIEEGVDGILIETIFDTLNAKAAAFAAERAMKDVGRKVPLMLSVTIANSGGRTLSGQTLEAFCASVSNFDIFSVGLNCSFGAAQMKPFIRRLASIAPYYISAYPNAGLPDEMGRYLQTPEMMLEEVKDLILGGMVNIIGGCCGTTDEHIRKYSEIIDQARPHVPVAAPGHLVLSGLDSIDIVPENNFINIGERCNVAGSRKFLRLIREKNYDEALSIAREQVESGAQILDVNMDDGMLEVRDEMVNFLNLVASDPDISRVPVMIDSSRWDVIEAGLKCLQGKSVVNSISLKEGEDEFVRKARFIMDYGASVVVMAFDEKGQADTFERKIEVCRRAYDILVNRVGMKPYNIIFDPNILAIGTGIREHDSYALDFIRAAEWIHNNLPGASISGGVSNLSFSFRGNNFIREALHAVFLHHAIMAGMNMGIVNPYSSVRYTDLSERELSVLEDFIFNRRSDALADVMALAGHEVNAGNDSRNAWRQLSVDERLSYSLQNGITDHIEEDIKEALALYPDPVQIIEKPLMNGMNIVGDLFAKGKMFLPQVVKTARTMKKAVNILQPYIEQNRTSSATSSGKVLLATVKGDVHDIGKNIVSVVMACNSFEIIDLGVMVPAEDIVRAAIDNKVDAVGLSGLITPSLDEMINVVSLMEAAGLRIPVLIGGATTSMRHTAIKIAPHYSGPVVYVRDASQNVPVLKKLLDKSLSEHFIREINDEYLKLRTNLADNSEGVLSLQEARKRKPDFFS